MTVSLVAVAAVQKTRLSQGQFHHLDGELKPEAFFSVFASLTEVRTNSS